MRTKEEQDAINQACKYHPTTKAELQELVNDKRINLGNVDTSQITDMSYLFDKSKRTNFSGIETWDVSNVTDMSFMFVDMDYFNQSLSQWDVSNVENMDGTFNKCGYNSEKFNIGNEFKTIMYKMLENILYINKIENTKRLYYLNLIDAELNTQRIMIRIMQKNKWIDEKKYKVSMELLYEIGKILGGLIKHYAKNNKKSI